LERAAFAVQFLNLFSIIFELSIWWIGIISLIPAHARTFLGVVFDTPTQLLSERASTEPLTHPFLFENPQKMVTKFEKLGGNRKLQLG
jgi:hypothetical protein